MVDDKKSNPIQDKKNLVVIFSLRNLNYPSQGSIMQKITELRGAFVKGQKQCKQSVR